MEEQEYNQVPYVTTGTMTISTPEDRAKPNKMIIIVLILIAIFIFYKSRKTA